MKSSKTKINKNKKKIKKFQWNRQRQKLLKKIKKFLWNSQRQKLLKNRKKLKNKKIFNKNLNDIIKNNSWWKIKIKKKILKI
jgi:hypothetical protein